MAGRDGANGNGSQKIRAAIPHFLAPSRPSRHCVKLHSPARYPRLPAGSGASAITIVFPLNADAITPISTTPAIAA